MQNKITHLFFQKFGIQQPAAAQQYVSTNKQTEKNDINIYTYSLSFLVQICSVYTPSF